MWKVSLSRIVVLASLFTFVFLGLALGQESSKVLRIGASETIRDWEPQRGTGHYEPELKQTIWERLVATKPGTWEVGPGIAKSWEFSEDRKQITFHLQQGVNFQKGMGELTAEDVAFSIQRTLDPKWELASPFDSLDRVEVLDKYTVRVHLKHPDASFISYQLAIGPGGYIVPKGTADWSVAEIRKNPVGSGAYELEVWRPMEKIVLKRFEGYHGKAPYFDKIEYTIFPQQETLELALENKQIDVGLISYKSLPRFRKLEGIKVYTGPRASYSWIGFNVTRKPFDDVRVRRAFRYAIDVEEIILGAFEGAPPRAKTMLAPEVFGHWKEAPTHEPDLEKAKALLKEAGLEQGLTATIVVSPANRGDLVAPILIEQLKRIGVTLVPTILTRPAQTSALKENQYDMYYIEMTGYARAPYEASRWFTCVQCTPKGWNLSKWCNKEFDELRDKAIYTTDEAKTAEYYVEMQKIMDEEVPHIWVHHGLAAIGYSQRILLEGAVNPDGRLVHSVIAPKE